MSVEVNPADLNPELLADVVHFHAQVEEARRECEEARERLKARKTQLEALQESFESAFKRLLNQAQSGQMPLFANQSEVLERAQADPVVQQIVHRLIAYGIDANAVLVAGYTEDERAAVTAWLDACDTANEAGDPLPEPPDLLRPQLTVFEVGDLVFRLARQGAVVEAEHVTAWGPGKLAEARAWLADCERIAEARGDALVAEDLPPMPSWLDALSADLEAEAAADAQLDAEAAEAGDRDGDGDGGVDKLEPDDAPAEA